MVSSPLDHAISSNITDVFVRADVILFDNELGVEAMRIPLYFPVGTSVMALAVTRKVTSICDRGQ